MTCGHCKMAVERLLREAGIEESTVDLATGVVSLKSDTEKVEQVIRSINESGIYTAEKA